MPTSEKIAIDGIKCSLKLNFSRRRGCFHDQFLQVSTFQSLQVAGIEGLVKVKETSRSEKKVKDRVKGKGQDGITYR